MTMRNIVLFLSLFFCFGCRETILHNLDESQANKVLVLLHEHMIPVEKEPEGIKWNVLVSKDEAILALKIIEGSRLLYRDLTREIQEPKGLLASKEERVAYLERQTAADLEKTIESIPGIIEAHIHFYVEDYNNEFRDKQEGYQLAF